MDTKYEVISFDFDGRQGYTYPFETLEAAVDFAETYLLAYQVRNDGKELPDETVAAMKQQLKI